jgi:hypothetical protein
MLLIRHPEFRNVRAPLLSVLTLTFLWPLEVALSTLAPTRGWRGVVSVWALNTAQDR